MDGSYGLEGPATVEGLTALHELVERVGRDYPEIDAGDLAMLETAVLEVAGNVVEHGTPPHQIWYWFSVEVTPDGLEALLVDTGDPLPAFDGAAADDPMAESGRGLALARAALTELTYERRDDSNAWRMTRAWSSPGSSARAEGPVAGG